MGHETQASKAKETIRRHLQGDQKDSAIELMKNLLREKELLLQLKAAENVELRASVKELERKWREAQSEIAELNLLHSLRRQSAQAGQFGLRKELEMARQNLELYENLTASAKLRELDQKQPDGVEQIKRSMSLRRKSSFVVKDSDHANRLRAVHKELVNKVLAPGVAAIMYERGALTLDELESVQCYRTLSESAKNLVDIIASLPYENYECFLKALKQADQEDVYRWLAYTDYDIDVKHTETIRQHYIFLREGLDMKCSSLLAELFAVEVLNAGEKDEIEAQPYMWQQNERLLSVLSRKSAEQFEMFLCALDRSGQKHIADRLREKSVENNNSSRLGSTTNLEQLQQQSTSEPQQIKKPKPPPPTPRKKDPSEEPTKPHLPPVLPPKQLKLATTLALSPESLTSSPPLVSPPSTPLHPPPPKPSNPTKPVPLLAVRTTSAPLDMSSSSPPPPLPERSISKNSFGDDGEEASTSETSSEPPDGLLATSCSKLSLSDKPINCCQDVVCVLVGDPDVDKTNLVLSFLYPGGAIDCESYIRVAPHMPQKLVTFGNVTYNLLLKDTTGHEDYDRLRIMSYNSAGVFIVCFSVVKSSSFDNVRDKWIPELRHHCPRTPLVLVGTQKERRVASSSTHSGTSSYQQFACKNDAKYLECSTISREGVEEVFIAAVEAKSRDNKRERKSRFKIL